MEYAGSVAWLKYIIYLFIYSPPTENNDGISFFVIDFCLLWKDLSHKLPSKRCRLVPATGCCSTCIELRLLWKQKTIVKTLENQVWKKKLTRKIHALGCNWKRSNSYGRRCILTYNFCKKYHFDFESLLEVCKIRPIWSSHHHTRQIRDQTVCKPHDWGLKWQIC